MSALHDEKISPSILRKIVKFFDALSDYTEIRNVKLRHGDAAVRAGWKIGGYSLFLPSEYGIHWERIEVPTKLRGAGIASAIVSNIVSASDGSGARVTTTVLPDGPRNKNFDAKHDRLIRFIRSFGFETDWETLSILHGESMSRLKSEHPLWSESRDQLIYIPKRGKR